MARYEVIFSGRAAKEITESWAWFEKQQQGLGHSFQQALDNRLEVLRQHPLRYPPRNGYYRYLIMHDFRFLIVFRTNQKKKVVTVTSVFHTSRNPKRRFGV